MEQQANFSQKFKAVNKQGIYLNEPLPKADTEMNAAAKQMGLETVMNNCVVSVFRLQ